MTSNPRTTMFGRLDQPLNPEHEQHRLQALADSGLLDAENLPVFEEATQTAAHFMGTPVCILGLVDRDRQWLRYSVGLSRLGLMNDLATSRQLPRCEAFCNQVITRRRALTIDDATLDPAYKDGLLVKTYGIQAYLGVPLINARGFCLGSLAVMDLTPRTFTPQEVTFLEMIARWCMSEYERHQVLKRSLTTLPALPDPPSPAPARVHPLQQVRTDLIVQMTHELMTPLTSVLGMTSVLQREIYGPLTEKQKEYLDVVHGSGQYLLAVVNEVLDLGRLDDRDCALDLAPVDTEMVGQQALQPLQGLAGRRGISLQLSVEPGHRIWLLDKDKVRQMLYHLVFGMIQSSSTDSTIHIHMSRKADKLHLLLWSAHPWLEESLHADLNRDRDYPGRAEDGGVAIAPASISTDEKSRQALGLDLSRHLAELHGGEFIIQTQNSGTRYLIILPQLTSTSDVSSS
jgi:signal transduction histidine kinase